MTVNAQTRSGLFINGEWRASETTLPVYDKFSGELLAALSAAGPQEVEQALAVAQARAKEGPLPAYRRYEILARVSSMLGDSAEAFARTIARESGKTLGEARYEVERAVQTLLLSAEEAKRVSGEQVPVASAPGVKPHQRLAVTLRVPVGVVAAITPFNYPLNLACHKVGPALAAGNSVVWKPASSTPLTAVLLTELFEAAGLPAGWLNLLVGSGREVGERLLEDPRINFYTFTGSVPVGEHIQKTVGLRRTSLELGSNCAVLVHEDADLKRAAEACVEGGFGYAGQNCDAVQRILVHEAVYEEFKEELLARTRRLRLGNPLEPTTDLGPMISEGEARRIEAWVHEAIQEGARLLTGGERDGVFFPPTVLENVDNGMKVVSEEVFAPVVTLMPYRDLDEGIALANRTRYGLQAGVFTRDLEVAWRVGREVEVGGVMINEQSSWRTDLMPFGGLKQSGVGREGPKYAVEEMTDLRLIVFHLTSNGG